MKSAQRVWFITGTSQGFGKELVKAALQMGDIVVATSRTPQKVREEFGEHSDRLLAVSLDLCDENQISSAVKNAIDTFGRIDVLVNNAGHGLLGAIEETNDTEILNLYETNVFGLIRVIREILPHMRSQKRGHIVNISSLGGLIGVPGWGVYSSTKFAIEGLSEALATEVAPFGIKVTIVEPGPFRTNFLSNSLKKTEKILTDYKDSSGKLRASTDERNGKQLGDPALAAKSILAAVLSEKPPLHLLLGSLAYELANKKLDSLREEFNLWKDETISSDFPMKKEEIAAYFGRS